MLSNKMTVSLMSLVIFLTIGLVVVSPATADVLGKDFSTTISLMGTGTLNSGTGAVEDLVPPAGDNVIAIGDEALLTVDFGKTVTAGPDADADESPPVLGGLFAPEDVAVVAFNKTTGAPVNVPGVTVAVVTGIPTRFSVSLGAINANTVVLVTIAEGAVTNNDPADVITAGTGDDTLGTNAKATLQFDVVGLSPVGEPRVVSVTDLPGAVIAPGNPDSFSFTVTLSEKPAAFTKAHIGVDVLIATVDSDPIALAAIDEGEDGGSTEASGRLYPYLVTITPKYATKDPSSSRFCRLTIQRSRRP